MCEHNTLILRATITRTMINTVNYEYIAVHFHDSIEAWTVDSLIR